MLQVCTVIQNEYHTFGHFRCKMAFFMRVWQKVKVLPHLCSIKIIIKDEWTFQMGYKVQYVSELPVVPKIHAIKVERTKSKSV